MSIANTIASKLTVAFVAVAMVFSVAVPAQAQTVEELQKMIADLMAQVAALSGGSTSGSAACTFSGALTVGAQGAQVTCLQNYLIGAGFSISAGATGYFGAQTQAAVAQWQAANGVAPAAGYFGPISIAKYNAVAGGSNGGNNGGSTGSADLQGGAGNLESADFVSSLNNEEVGEDQEDVEVVGLELEADDNSDLRVTAVRVEFEQNAGDTGSDDFDDYAEEVTVWFAGEQVGSVDVDDMSDSSGVWSSTISIDSSAVIRRGDTEDLTIAVSALSNIDTSDLGTGKGGWDVNVANVRYVDAQGAIITESTLDDVGTETRTFIFDSFASANDVELSISETDDNPEADSVEVDEDGGDEVVLAAGEMEAEGSDLVIDELTTEITPAGTGDILDQAARFILVIDGEEVDTLDADECVDDTCTGTEEYKFQDFEFELGEGDTVEFSIVVELNELDGTLFVGGDSLTATVNADDINAEDEAGDDLANTEKNGSVNGEAQSFFVNGIAVTVTDKTTDVTGVDGSNNDIVEFTFEFDVTAFGEDVYVNKDIADIVTSSGADDVDTIYSIEKSTGAVLTSVSATIVTTSGADTVNGDANAYTDAYASETFFVIEEGQTETFVLTISGTNQTDSKQVRALLNNIEWTTDTVNATDKDASAADINAYTSNLGSDAATPFRTVN